MPSGILTTHLMLHRLCVIARESGIDTSSLLLSHGLPPDADQESPRLFPASNVLAAHQDLAARLHDPALGLTLAARFAAHDYGVFGYVARHSEHMFGAMTLLQEYLNVLWRGYTFQVTEHDGLVTLRAAFSRRAPGDDIWHQELFASLYRISSESAVRHFVPVAVRFTQPPVAPERFLAAFHVLPEFSAAHNELVLSSADARVRLSTADARLLAHLRVAVTAQVEARSVAEGGEQNLLRLNGCTVDLRRGVVRRGAESTTLTTKEKALLEYFSRRINQVVTREELETDIWGIGKTVISHAPAVAIRRLRQKIEPDEGRPINLITVFGEGWKLQRFLPDEEA